MEIIEKKVIVYRNQERARRIKKYTVISLAMSV